MRYFCFFLIDFDSPILIYECYNVFLCFYFKVTRTIGDAYLKRPDFTFRDSFPQDTNGPKLPSSCVLSAEPEMRSRPLRDSDKFLIFASDGLWDFMTNEQAAQIVSSNPRNVCIYIYIYINDLFFHS